MKKTLSLLTFFLAISAMVVLQSCEEDEPLVPPTLTAPATVSSVQIGAKTDVTFAFTSAEGFASSSVTASGGTATVKTNPSAGAKDGSVVVEYTADNTAGAGSVSLTITDSKGQTINQTAVLNKTISAPPSLSLSITTANAIQGSNVNVSVIVTAGNGVKTLTVTGATSTPASPITLSGASPLTQAVAIVVPATAVPGSKITAVFTTTDQQNLVSSPVSLEITVLDATIILSGNLTSQALDATKKYLLRGQTFIPDGVTLTIPAGTVLFGEKATKAALIVRPGGKLIANGTASNPVVFTSNQAPGERDKGDWAGIVMLGKAFVNQPGLVFIEGISPQVSYGAKFADATAAVDFTTNANDNSGVLNYVRIEYAGIELSPNNETNSLTMGGVGNGTAINYVQVSYGGDDGFEWFGGTVNGKYLISQATWDDDFDTDFGWSGKVQFGLAVRYPFAADQSESNAFESDSQGNGNEIFSNGTTGTPWCTNTERGGCTNAVFSNITVLGPRDLSSPARSISANNRNALHIRRRSSISVLNSYFSGFRIGLRIDDAGTLGNLTSGNSVWANNILAVPGTTAIGNSTTAADASFATGLTLDNAGTVGSGTAGNATAIHDFWNATNTTLQASPAWTSAANPYADLGINLNWYWGGAGVASYVAPNFTVTAGTLSSGAAFTNPKVSDPFFTSVTFRGAFGANNWTSGWAEFVPQTKVY